MRGSHAQPQPSRILGNRREKHRRGQNAVITQSPGKQPSGGLVIEDDRNDRRLRQPGVIAKRAQTTPQKVRIVLDFGYPLRLLVQNRQALPDRGHRRRAQSCGKNKRRCPMLKIDGKFTGHSSKTTSGGNGLSQPTSPDVYFLRRDAEVFIGSPAAGST